MPSCMGYLVKNNFINLPKMCHTFKVWHMYAINFMVTIVDLPILHLLFSRNHASA